MVQRFRILLFRPAIQAAARNFGWLVADKGVRLILGVGIGFWLARYLGPARLGMLGYCTALVTLLGFLPSLGLDAVVKRELLQKPETSSLLVATAMAMRVMAGGAVYLVVLIAAAAGWGVHGEERRLVALLGGLLLQPAVLTPDLWLQAHLRAAWSVSAQLIALVVCSALRIGLILSGAGLAAFASVVVLEMALGGAGVMFAARRLGLRWPWSSVHMPTMRVLASEAWPLMFASLAILVYMRIDEVMLRHLSGPEAVGIYAAAVKLSEVWYFLPMVLASSVLPALLRAREQGAARYAVRLQQYYDGSAAAAYLLSVPVALAAPWLVHIAYGNAFSAAGPILAVHIWSSVFVFLGVARGQWLVNEGLPGFYLAATVGGAVANVALNFLLIPRWAGLGAAYATLIAYGLAGWIASFCHPAVRSTALMQTRALLIPLLGWRYLRAR